MSAKIDFRDRKSPPMVPALSTRLRFGLRNGFFSSGYEKN
jgi:hypothetical protein